MVDKLILLSSRLESPFAKLAKAHGERTSGYAAVIDLRRTKFHISARLYYRGCYNGIHKLEFIDVARLGLRRTLEITKQVFGRIEGVKIARIDLCVDVLGKTVEYFVSNCLIPNVQNYKIFRSRGAISYYPQVSATRTLLIYDKYAELIAKKMSSASALGPGPLTRIELQFKGSGVRFKRLSEISKYSQIEPFNDVRWLKLKVQPNQRAIQFLAQVGLRSLNKGHGLQRVSKMFMSPVWAYIRSKFLQPMGSSETPNLNALFQKSLDDWLQGRIRFPRSCANQLKEEIL